MADGNEMSLEYEAKIAELQEYYASARSQCDRAQEIARLRKDEVASLKAKFAELEKRHVDLLSAETWENTEAFKDILNAERIENSRLAFRVAELENNRSENYWGRRYNEAVKELDELKAFRLKVAQTVGIVYQADGHADAPGPDDTVLGELERIKHEALRVFELESELVARRAYDEDVRAAVNALLDLHDPEPEVTERLLAAPWLKKGGER